MTYHRLDAEQAILGALLLDGAVLEHLSALDAEHFYDPVHQRLYTEIRRLAGIGRSADAMSLKAWANADPGCAEIGGHAYLLKLMPAAATLTYQAVSYAEIVRDMAARRALAAALQDASTALPTGDVLDVTAALEASLRTVGDHGDGFGADLDDASAAFIAHMDKTALSTGILALDERLGGLHPGELTILAGRPSMGKTALADQIARNIAEAGGVVHFASLEMPKEALAARSMSAFSWRREYGTQRVQYYHLRNGSNVDRGLLHSLAAELPRSLVIDDRAGQTLAQLEQSARATRRRKKRLDVIVVDYLQLMCAARGDGRVNEITEISQGLKVIAKRLGVPVVALSQLSRGVESRENKRPGLSDLRDSGSIEQDADVVLACYREEYYLSRNPPAPEAPVGDHVAWKAKLERVRCDLEVITLKQRAGPTGTDVLTCHLEYDVIRDRVAA